MEFIQKHWARLSMALLFLLGAVATISLYASDFDIMDEAIYWYPFVAALLFFIGSAAVGILKIFAPKYVGFVYGTVGGIITILFTVILAVEDFDGELYIDIYWRYVVPLIVFGIQPLVRGLIKFIEGERPFSSDNPKVAPAPKAEEAPAKKAAK
jgi:hypothetical protein